MNTRVKQQIESLARQSPDKEICGFIYHDLYSSKILSCPNLSPDPLNFEISSDDYMKCLKLGTITAIYHSHIVKDGFSDDDLALADEMELPILMFHVPTNTWNEYIPKHYKIQLESRQFIWGELDCYGIVRAYLRQERGIYISDYDRDEGFADSGNDAIMENFSKEGYCDLGRTLDLKIGDVLCFRFGRAKNPHHLAVFIGNTTILHHQLGLLSCKELLTPKLTDRLTNVFRHKNDMK